ncbi:hypothetical protein C0993_006200 [Termitomyces sp. T159_Od127]|nr:hypothetical protein C0993_006200 [Termitomyces sp. T159_Od127]
MLFSIAPQLAALTVTLFVTLWLSVYTQRYKAKCGRVLPPGPPGVPLLGSLLDIPGKHLGTYFRRLLREYGGLASVNLVGFRLILIGDIKVAKELLEKHSAKHSSRPVVHYIRNHVDPVDAYWLVSKGGKNHTIARKLAARLMSTVKAGETEPLHEFEATLNVRRLLDNGGQQWYNHMCR